MEKTLLLLWLNFLIAITTYTQSLPTTRKAFYSNEKDRAKNALILRDYYLDESPDSIYPLGSFLIHEGLRHENLAWVNLGKLIISSYYYEHGKPEISIENLSACLTYYERKRDWERLADAQNMMGLALMFQLKNKEAVHWFLKSLQTADKLDVENESYMAQINMVEAFYRLERYNSAEKELWSFISKVKKQHLDKGLRKAYQLMGKIYFSSERLVKGIEFYQKSLHLAYQNGDKLGLSFANNEMAIAYFQQGKIGKAEDFFKKSLKLRKEINNPSVICESYFNLGEFYFFKEDYPTAIAYYDSSNMLAAKNNFLNEQVDALGRVGECYHMMKQDGQAYDYLSQQLIVQHQMLKKSQEDTYSISENYHQYREDEKKLEQKIRERELQSRIDKEEKRRYILLLTVVVLAAIFLFLFLKTRKGNSE